MSKEKLAMSKVTQLPAMAIVLAAAVFALAIACKNDDGGGDPEPAHVHDYQWSVTTAATCIAKGLETGVCKLDATHTTTREIAIDLVDGHDYGDWTGTVTCTEAGTGTRVCSRSEAHTETDNNLSALGHDYEWTTTTPANETTDGEETGVCSHDSSTKTRTLYATGTPGLAYELITSGDNANTYRVYATSSTNPAGNVVIPAYHRPDVDSPYLPVTEISNGTDSYDNNAFGGTNIMSNTSVTGITFTEGSQLKTISDYAFVQCTSLTSINIPDSVTAIGNNAFENCYGLTTVSFAEGSQLPTIGNSAFALCTGLTSIDIPAKVTTISDYAFVQCTSLTSINIPASVMSIGQDVFAECTGLTSITADNSNPNYASESGLLYNKAKTSILIVPPGIDNVTIPATVSLIGDRAFFNCANLETVTFTNGSQLITIGNFAFTRCTKLTAITIPAGVTSIGERAFGQCTSLTSVDIPASVTTISNYAFYMTDLKTVIFPNNSQLQSIGNSAFMTCPSLESVDFGTNSQLQSIGNGAFTGSTSLTSITIPASVTSVGNQAFYDWTAEQTINVPFANANATPSGWNANWNYGSNAVIKYWNGTTWE